MPSPSRRIVHVAATPEGAPWLVSLAREQRRRGHEVQVILNGIDGGLGAALRAANIGVSAIPMRFPGPSAPGVVAQIRDLASRLSTLKPDVVHTHLFGSVILGRFAAWAADVPRRYSMIAGPYCLESPGLAWIETDTAWTDTRVIATCEFTRTLYAAAGVPQSRLALAYYGLDVSRFDPAAADRAAARRSLGLADTDRAIGLVAYFYPPASAALFCPPGLVGLSVKGHDIAIRAMRHILEVEPTAKLVLVGSGFGPGGEAHRDQMRALAVQLGVAPAVVFADNRNDVPDVLSAMDVAIHCSRSENLGGSIEALSMARPFVATRVGGLVDTIKHEETGLLVDADDPPALAAAILRLLRDPSLAARLGNAGRRAMLDRFTVQHTADDLDRLYHADPDEGYRAGVVETRLRKLPRHLAPIIWKLRASQVRSPGLLWERIWRRIRRMTRAGTP